MNAILRRLASAWLACVVAFIPIAAGAGGGSYMISGGAYPPPVFRYQASVAATKASASKLASVGGILFGEAVLATNRPITLEFAQGVLHLVTSEGSFIVEGYGEAWVLPIAHVVESGETGWFTASGGILQNAWLWHPHLVHTHLGDALATEDVGLPITWSPPSCSDVHHWLINDAGRTVELKLSTNNAILSGGPEVYAWRPTDLGPVADPLCTKFLTSGLQPDSVLARSMRLAALMQYAKRTNPVAWAAFLKSLPTFR